MALDARTAGRVDGLETGSPVVVARAARRGDAVLFSRLGELRIGPSRASCSCRRAADGRCFPGSLFFTRPPRAVPDTSRRPRPEWGGRARRLLRVAFRDAPIDWGTSGFSCRHAVLQRNTFERCRQASRRTGEPPDLGSRCVRHARLMIGARLPGEDWLACSAPATAPRVVAALICGIGDVAIRGWRYSCPTPGLLDSPANGTTGIGPLCFRGGAVGRLVEGRKCEHTAARASAWVSTAGDPT